MTAGKGVLVFSGDQAREHSQAAGGDREIVIAAAKSRSSKFRYAQTTALGAVVDRQVLKRDDAVNDRVNLQVTAGDFVVQHQHCAAIAGQVLFQREYLTSKA